MPNKHWLIAIIIMFLSIIIPYYVYSADTWEDNLFHDDNLYLDLVIDSSGSVYIYEPKRNIVLYELALIMPVFFGGSALYIEQLPPEAKRHFRKEN